LTDSLVRFEKYFAKKFTASDMTLKNWTATAKDELGSSFANASSKDQEKIKSMLKDLWSEEILDVRDDVPMGFRRSFDDATEMLKTPSEALKEIKQKIILIKQKSKKGNEYLRQRPRKWSVEEEQYVRENQDVKTEELVERLPGRTRSSVRIKRWRLFRG